MGAGKRYSAGAIFLQVVPVFANVQRAIEDEAKNIDRALGDQMEKSGEKAGERAGKAASKSMNEEIAKGSRNISDDMERELRKGVDGMNKALGDIDTKNLGKKLRSEVKGMRAELESLSDVDLKIDDNVDKVAAKVQALRAQVEDMRKRSKVFFDIKGLPEVYRKITQVDAAIKAIDGTINVDVDTKGAERQMGAFEKSFKRTADRAAKHLGTSMNKEARKLKDELKYLENLRIGIDISSGQARKELLEIMADLKKLSTDDPNIDVKVDAGRAWSEIAALEAALAKIDGQDVEVDVKVDKARSGLFGLSADGDKAANTFRSFNGVILAATTAGPALIPVLGGIAGGLLALGPAAAVAAGGLTSVFIGFSGIGDALSALGNQQDHLSQSTAQAAKTEQSSAEAVARAREAAAEAVENALDRQKDAQERYRDSITDVKDAEQALREAREAAKGTGDDIGDRIKDNQLAQDQGLLDVFNTTVAFNSTMADGSATNAEKEQARINMEQAKRALEELREEAKELAKEKKKWDKEGVNGTEQVESAQEHLNDAIDAQKDAYEALGDAAEDVDKARKDGAESVRDALASQAEAMEQVNAQQAAVDAAFGKLGESGQAFALFMFDLRKGFYDFRDDIQAVLLPAVQEAMESFFQSDSAKVARDALIGLAESFGRFVKALSASFQGPAWTGFFQMLADLGPGIQEAYGGAFIKFMEAIASMLTTSGPFALTFAKGLEKMMTAFADWAASKQGQDALLHFLDWVQKIGPDVLDFLGSFAEAAVNVVRALAPWGMVVLQVLTGFLDIIAAMDPTVLGAILTTLVVLTAASQVAYGIMQLVISLGALSALAIGPWILGLVAVAAVVAALYTSNKDFRDFVKKAWGEISEAFDKAWKKYLQPALENLWDAVSQLWDEVLAPFFAWLGPIILWIAVHYIPILVRYWAFLANSLAWAIRHLIIPGIKLLAHFFKWLWTDVLRPTWNAIRTAAVWLWKNALRPAFNGISDAWDGLVNGMAWLWENVLQPAWNYITDTALPALQDGFQTTVDAIGTIWDGLQALFATPIDFLIDGVINNGIIDGYNTVAGWVGADKLDHITVPDYIQKHSAFATGGVLPGYTPGRDVHEFYSPSAGRLSLSGGEAIMRPEWTAAMGPEYVNYMNSLAARGGSKAIQQAMYGKGGYWMGGVLPLTGGSFAQHTSGYSGFAGDLNWGSGYADYGMAVKAWKDGIVAQLNYIGDQSYGRWAVLNHADNQSSLYAHLSNFAKIAVGDAVKAGQTIGYVGDLGNTGEPPTSHLHFEINGGSVGYADSSTEESRHRSIPGWLMDIVKDPLGAVKGWITKPLGNLPGAVLDTPLLGVIKGIPGLMVNKVTDKVWDVIPGWVKTAAGWAGDAAGWVKGGISAVGDGIGNVVSGAGDLAGAGLDAIGLKDGGILPYNGTMMYDNGGYLPPGLTSVVNLTGKPEPVFTADQWDGMEGGGQGGTIHYEPHFEGSNLTAADVAADLNFTYRRIRRGGKYAGVGDQ